MQQPLNRNFRAADSKFYVKLLPLTTKKIQIFYLISFYASILSLKKKRKLTAFSVLYNSLFSQNKPIMKVKLRKWFSLSQQDKKVNFIKKIKRLFIDRYRWHKNEEFLRYKMFRKFFKRQFRKFRHISKNRLFITLFRGHFHEVTGFSEKNIMQLWFRFKRGTNKYWGHINLVQKFSQSILLMPHNLALFFNLAPSLSAARSLVQSGALVVNGLTSLNLKYFVRPGDTIQITPRIWSAVKGLYNYQRWTYLQSKLIYVSFFQIDWSMLLFTMVSWPRGFEMLPPSFLSERWIRYYIRQLPVRNRKYQKVKMVWKEHSRLQFTRK